MPAATDVATREDRAHAARAIALAGRAHGSTAPNPAVGCVLVAGGTVVGEGATRPAGGPHAEVVALDTAGDAARGATAYVTLEPCAHHGRTPPCAQALVDAGVARVVVAQRDPNPVAAGGLTHLRRHGVVVDVLDGVLSGATAVLLEGFLTHVRRGRPHVTLKLAQTSDGRLVPPTAGRFITAEAARRSVHRWRRQVDAVLVGSGTVVADDPRLDVRAVPLGDRPQPRPVVFDARLRTPPTAQVVARRAVIVTTDAAPAAARAALARAGADVVPVPAGAGGGVDPVAALAALGGLGITSVLAEPGRQLATALLAADLVDRLVWHVAPRAGDGPARYAVAVPDAGGWQLERSGGAGPDLVVHRIRVRSGSVPSSTPLQEAV